MQIFNRLYASFQQMSFGLGKNWPSKSPALSLGHNEVGQKQDDLRKQNQ
jgi:hypothetical protein